VRTAPLLLQDMLEAVDVIARYTPDSFERFESDPPVQSHIIRHIAIIGEAASRLPKEVRDAHVDIPWRQMSDMRNIVIHVYHGINWLRVYETARDHVPQLRP
jgi:uncharacterized protein with HEPN domain